MKQIIVTCVLLVSLLAPHALLADDHEEHHGLNEVGVSGGAIYDFDHNRWGGGMHLHYFRKLGERSRWSFGGGLEQVWDDGHHFTIGLGAKFEAIERLELGVMPGVTFFSHEDAHDDHYHGSDAQFSLHFELVYDLLHWRWLHVGPTLDYSWVPAAGDSHVMLGGHAAVCF